MWIFAALSLAKVVAAEPTQPLSVPPSQWWDGNDGQWSTFWIQIGTPPQTVRVLPSTSASAGSGIWAVLPQGCTPMNESLASLWCARSQTQGCSVIGDFNCPEDRGYLFLPNESTTWSTSGLETTGKSGVLWDLNVVEEKSLDEAYAAAGSYGYDSVSFGLLGSNIPTLHKQLIAGIVTKDFYLGTLGLSPYGFNFSDYNDPVPSLLGTLVNQSLIPSTSWAYTAGAQYRGTFGSLTLGGYDTTRFIQNNITFAFGPDPTRDLLISLRSITYDISGAMPLLASSVDMFIDSLISDLWLPVEVCEAFGSQFNLTFDGSHYSVSDSAHSVLLAENPTFTFTIGQSGTQEGSSVEIVLPYSAFDRRLSTSNLNGTRYFPLRQGHNSSQYTLGRTFLQEAYIIADYERQNFSVSQASFPDTSVKQNLVAIQKEGINESSNGNSPPLTSEADTTGGLGLSIGAIVGIALSGSFALMAFVGTVVFYYCRRRKLRGAATAQSVCDEELSPSSLPEEIDAQETQVCELREGEVKLELATPQSVWSRHEMPARASFRELDGKEVYQPTTWI